MTQNKFFWKIIKKYRKKAEFPADFESVEKVVKKSTQKSYKQNKFDKHEQKCIFSKLFQRIRNQREILCFLIPILNFVIKFFFGSY
jgi:hypothetical protein